MINLNDLLTGQIQKQRYFVTFVCCLLYFPVSALTWAYGSYVGNGTDGHTITGLSFSPDVVIIKGAGATPAYIKTTTLAGTSSQSLVATAAYSSTAIKSLTSSGFTLGTNSGVNTNGTVYYFIAFNEDADVVEGSYVGDGSTGQAVSGLGMQPEMVLIYSNSTLYPAGYNTNAMGADNSVTFANAGLWAWGVKSLDATGFTAGTYYTTSGTTFYYVAFNAPSNAYMRTGSYAGASGADKTVAVAGTTPQAIFICNNDGSAKAIQKFASMPSTSSAYFSANATFVTGITAFASGSFTTKNGSVDANNTFFTNYYAIFGSGTALPIELQDFKVSCDNGSSRISWITATETNNDFFTVERSKDGVHFEVVGTRKGAGFSNEPRYYSLFDDYSAEQVLYYRLTQTDYDGKSKSFEMKPLGACHRLVSGVNVNLYPNPFEEEVKYQFELAQDASIQVQVIDLLGQTVYSQNVVASAGNNLLTLDLHSFSKGMYIFKMYDGERYHEQKITKQ